jgi:hypothetical protein
MPTAKGHVRMLAYFSSISIVLDIDSSAEIDVGCFQLRPSFFICVSDSTVSFEKWDVRVPLPLKNGENYGGVQFNGLVCMALVFFFNFR